MEIFLNYFIIRCISQEALKGFPVHMEESVEELAKNGAEMR